jgi:serine/threonine protein kinase
LLDYVNNNGKLSESQARRYFLQLIAFLESLHLEMRIAHRDLKPENLMLDENNNIIVTDFGLSN